MSDLLIEYLGKYRTMALATCDTDGNVDCSSVYFAFDTAGRIYFTADESTAKAANLRATGRFAIAMDDGGLASTGVKLSGDEVKVITTAEDVEATKQLLVRRNPAIAPFLKNEKMVFFQLTPKRRVVINFSWGLNWRVDA